MATGNFLFLARITFDVYFDLSGSAGIECHACAARPQTARFIDAFVAFSVYMCASVICKQSEIQNAVKIQAGQFRCPHMSHLQLIEDLWTKSLCVIYCFSHLDPFNFRELHCSPSNLRHFLAKPTNDQRINKKCLCFPLLLRVHCIYSLEISSAKHFFQ